MFMWVTTQQKVWEMSGWSRRWLNQSAKIMPGAWVEEQKRGREHSLVPEEKAGIFANSACWFRFIGICIPKIIAFPNACALVGSSRGGLCYSYCKLKATFCQFSVFTDRGSRTDYSVTPPVSGGQRCRLVEWYRVLCPSSPLPASPWSRRLQCPG